MIVKIKKAILFKIIKNVGLVKAALIIAMKVKIVIIMI